MSESAVREKSSTALEPTVSKQSGREEDKAREETIREEEEDASAHTTPPKDLRFWLIILGLLVATFLAALDLTGKYTTQLIPAHQEC